MRSKGGKTYYIYYNFYCRFSILVNLLEEGWIFYDFHCKFPIVVTPTVVGIYGFYYQFSIVVTPPEER